MLIRVGCLALLLAACGGGSTAEEPPPEASTGDEAPPEPSGPEGAMSVEDCTAQGGTVVGDIGDGAVHRPDYVCPSGQPPIGSVAQGIEGSACCPP